jgi:RNA polymerase sigma-70 factor, ECF subfamily
MDEYTLIQSILNGSPSDFERLIKKYQPNVFRTAMGLLHNKEDAEEITQDVFLKIYDSLPSFNQKAALSTWVYRVTINTSLNFLKKKKGNRLLVGLSALLGLASKEKESEKLLTDKEQKDAIRKAMQELPEKQRLAFVLTKYEELPQRQVAEIMQISEGAVEQLVIRARNNLRKKLEKKWISP